MLVKPWLIHLLYCSSKFKIASIISSVVLPKVLGDLISTLGPSSAIYRILLPIYSSLCKILPFSSIFSPCLALNTVVYQLMALFASFTMSYGFRVENRLASGSYAGIFSVKMNVCPNGH